jgi:hypothetical protein
MLDFSLDGLQLGGELIELLQDGRWLLAPPALDDGIQSFTYWRKRRARLPWYRIAARREAARMMIRWEQRVAAELRAELRTRVASMSSGGHALEFEARVPSPDWGDVASRPRSDAAAL